MVTKVKEAHNPEFQTLLSCQIHQIGREKSIFNIPHIKFTYKLQNPCVYFLHKQQQSIKRENYKSNRRNKSIRRRKGVENAILLLNTLIDVVPPIGRRQRPKWQSRHFTSPSSFSSSLQISQIIIDTYKEENNKEGMC